MAVNPWTLYWQADNPESCVPTQNIADTEKVAAFWHQLARQLPNDARVLDLACGNGVVATHLLANNPSLEITGVDQATISPTHFLADSGDLEKVKFLPETDVTALPFADESFAGITSQFGLEYAPIEDAVREAARVLRPQGKIALLMHHKESEIVVPSQRQLLEINGLLAPAALMDHLQQFLAGEIELQQLESYGQEYLQTPGDKTSQISGQIFEGINRIIALIDSNRISAQELTQTMQLRLRADQQRLQQMSAAALDAKRLKHYVSCFAEAHVNIEVAEPFFLKEEGEQNALIAWQLIGSKSEIDG